jgi:hypothetical protein
LFPSSPTGSFFKSGKPKWNITKNLRIIFPVFVHFIFVAQMIDGFGRVNYFCFFA